LCFIFFRAKDWNKAAEESGTEELPFNLENHHFTNRNIIWKYNGKGLFFYGTYYMGSWEYHMEMESHIYSYWCVLRRVAGWVAGMMTLGINDEMDHSRKFPTFLTQQ